MGGPLRRAGRSVRRLWLPLLALAVVAPPGVLAAQAGETGATPFISRGHWALDAARRLEAAGLADAAYDPGTTTVAVGRLATLFAAAEREAADRSPGLRALAAGYRARLLEEFPGLERDPGASVRHLGGVVQAQYERVTGRALAGEGYFEDDWTGPRPVEDASTGGARVAWAGAVGRHVAAHVSAFAGDEARLEEGHVAVGAGPGALWVGRRALRFGTGMGGGLVIDDRISLDAVGVSIDAFHLPWIFDALGPVRIETSVSRLDANGSFDAPWLLTMRGRVAPHPRLAIGLNRASMMGGEGNASVPFDELLQGLIGARPGDSRFDNQIASIDVRFRPPVGDLPLVTYFEWGAEDSSGALFDVPGLIGGVMIAAVPGAPELALGVEAASFAESCCGNPRWYRHWNFREGWSDEGRLLAHGLGGHGHELQLYGLVDAMEARLRLDGGVFLRERRSENVHAPDRAGRSVGARLDADFRPDARFELFVRSRVEDGAGWDALTMATGLRWVF